MTRTYVPIPEGGISDYASGPEHQFFLWDTAASALPGTTGEVPTPTPRPTGITSAAQPPTFDRGDGSDFGGGAYGTRNRDVEMMGRGRAPLTGAGIMAALGNAMGVVNPISTTAKMALGQATGMGMGGWSNIPGQTPYDRDLVDAVRQGRMTRAQADNVQAGRNRGGGGNGAQHDRQGVSAGAGPGGRAAQGGGAYGGMGGVGAYGMANGGRTNFIAGAIKRPGALTRKARAAGMGVQSFAHAHEHDSGLTGQQARFALLLNKVRPGHANGGIAGYARGGMMDNEAMEPMPDREMGPGEPVAGGINSPTGGRADQVEETAEEGTYIVPADVVSALGDGNTEAGKAILDRVVQNLLQRTGAQPGNMGNRGNMGQNPGMARGGSVPIRVSGGEYAIPPHVVAAHGGGSHKRGADLLDMKVAEIRARHSAKLKRLPPPRR